MQISPDVWGALYFPTAGPLYLPKLRQLLCILSGISKTSHQLDSMCFLQGYNMTPWIKVRR